MPLPRRKFFGWYDQRRNAFLLSTWPPDAPVRPSIGFDDKAELKSFIDRKRCQVTWLPPLTVDQAEGLIA